MGTGRTNTSSRHIRNVYLPLLNQDVPIGTQYHLNMNHNSSNNNSNNDGAGTLGVGLDGNGGSCKSHPGATKVVSAIAAFGQPTLKEVEELLEIGGGRINFQLTQ
eukprot:4797098-Amphidinium_carterae.1